MLGVAIMISIAILVIALMFLGASIEEPAPHDTRMLMRDAAADMDDLPHRRR